MLFRKRTASILAVALLVATPSFITPTVNHISSQAHATSRIVDIGEAYSPSNASSTYLATMEKVGANHIVTEDEDFDKVKEVKRIWLNSNVNL